LLGLAGVANFGSTVPAFRYFLMVFRDKPVRRETSRIGSSSRNAMRRMMFKSPMWITPSSPNACCFGGRVTWVKSQWKFRTCPADFSVEINIRSFFASALLVTLSACWITARPSTGTSSLGTRRRYYQTPLRSIRWVVTDILFIPLVYHKSAAGGKAKTLL
jgi:hypothetical protein